jgi:hypothetical protein
MPVKTAPRLSESVTWVMGPPCQRTNPRGSKVRPGPFGPVDAYGTWLPEMLPTGMMRLHNAGPSNS